MFTHTQVQLEKISCATPLVCFLFLPTPPVHIHTQTHTHTHSQLFRTALFMFFFPQQLDSHSNHQISQGLVDSLQTLLCRFNLPYHTRLFKDTLSVTLLCLKVKCIIIHCNQGSKLEMFLLFFQLVAETVC